MSHNRFSPELWNVIRERWERGESSTSISKTHDYPSHTAIDNRRDSEGWIREIALADVAAMPDHLLDNLSSNQQAVLRAIAKGFNQRTAAGLAGVHENRISEWKKNADYLTAHECAVAVKTGNRIGVIEEAAKADYRAAQWLLTKDPESRKDWGSDAPVVTGNTFNVLGRLDLGIDRS